MNQASIEEKRNTASQWADIAGQILDNLMGKNVSMTYSFENLRIEIPRAEGPGGQHIGSAQWTINGKIMVTTET